MSPTVNNNMFAKTEMFRLLRRIESVASMIRDGTPATDAIASDFLPGQTVSLSDELRLSLWKIHRLITTLYNTYEFRIYYIETTRAALDIDDPKNWSLLCTTAYNPYNEYQRIDDVYEYTRSEVAPHGRPVSTSRCWGDFEDNNGNEETDPSDVYKLVKAYTGPLFSEPYVPAYHKLLLDERFARASTHLSRFMSLRFGIFEDEVWNAMNTHTPADFQPNVCAIMHPGDRDSLLPDLDRSVLGGRSDRYITSEIVYKRHDSTIQTTTSLQVLLDMLRNLYIEPFTFNYRNVVDKLSLPGRDNDRILKTLLYDLSNTCENARNCCTR
jgi:hypothetical protein